MSAPEHLPLPASDAPARPDWPEAARLPLPDEAATDALAHRLAGCLSSGDTVLLSGALGAGKTHLARALIRARLGSPNEPVPSPSFTLVQTYGAPDGTEIWHADLYRLGDPGEVAELGLDEALGQAICLIEWPDRLAPDWPIGAVLLHLERAADEARTARLFAPSDTALTARLLPAFAA
jgi:tRNA threonylcarbamoyladenosine biosynthesis protein TsaE